MADRKEGQRKEREENARGGPIEDRRTHALDVSVPPPESARRLSSSWRQSAWLALKPYVESGVKELVKAGIQWAFKSMTAQIMTACRLQLDFGMQRTPVRSPALGSAWVFCVVQ